VSTVKKIRSARRTRFRFYFCLFLLCTPLRADKGPLIWVTSSLERVERSGPAGKTQAAQLSAARGEYESFQIVVRAPADRELTHVNVTISDLTNSSGQKIAKNQLELFREHYVHVTKSSPDWNGSNRPLGVGWYSDGLIPFVDPDTGRPPTGGKLRAAPFNLSAGTNQPIWVDVFVPRTAAPGQYTGSFIVTSDQGSATGEIALDVWNFTLPIAPTLKSAFVVTEAPPTAVARTLLRNKVSPLGVPPAQARELINQFGLSASNLGFWSGADVSRCTMSPVPAGGEIALAIAKYPPDLKLFDFVADEVGKCTGLYPQIRQWALAMHRAGVKNLVTMAPVPELMDDGSGTGRSAVDMWVVLPETYDKATNRIAQALAKGDEVWSYNTLVQDAYSPKWEIDFTPIDFRIQPGFISQSLNLSGLLYWRADLWSSDPWNDVNNVGKFSSNNYPGEGTLVYPGKAVGIVGTAPSMRLKWIRDGVEDYEYVALLKKAGYGTWALEVARSVGRDWHTWTRDPNAVESARRRLGQKLDALATGADSRPPSAQPKR